MLIIIRILVIEAIIILVNREAFISFDDYAEYIGKFYKKGIRRELKEIRMFYLLIGMWLWKFVKGMIRGMFEE